MRMTRRIARAKNRSEGEEPPCVKYTVNNQRTGKRPKQERDPSRKEITSMKMDFRASTNREIKPQTTPGGFYPSLRQMMTMEALGQCLNPGKHRS